MASFPAAVDVGLMPAKLLPSPRFLSNPLPLAIGFGLWMVIPSTPSGGRGPRAPNSPPSRSSSPRRSSPFLTVDDQTPTTQSLKGKVWIADFIFTHCGNTCPKMTASAWSSAEDYRPAVFLSLSIPARRRDAGKLRREVSRWPRGNSARPITTVLKTRGR
jgi:hypothetical protein